MLKSKELSEAIEFQFDNDTFYALKRKTSIYTYRIVCKHNFGWIDVNTKTQCISNYKHASNDCTPLSDLRDIAVHFMIVVLGIDPVKARHNF